MILENSKTEAISALLNIPPRAYLSIRSSGWEMWLGMGWLVGKGWAVYRGEYDFQLKKRREAKKYLKESR